MTHTLSALSHLASLFPAQRATVRGWGAAALLLILACLGPAGPGGAATQTPPKTPKSGKGPPPEASSQAYTYGTVRTVQDAANLVVVTPELARISVRLLGVEPPVVSRPAQDGGTPVPGQPFGREAETYARDLVLDKQVQLDTYGTDRKGRILAVVWLGGINVNVALVKEGLAWVGPSIPITKVRAELEVAGRQAQVGKYGLWALPNPEPPWEYRKSHHLPAD
ncbi:MAG TPA: thermonuclease family protein [Candidatus Methylomirabilis sp.]|nr:thermonuclease family protein [Candidatus Methylomirabilis sp.]